MKILLNQGAVTVEVHTKLKNALSNKEGIRAIINHLSINSTLIISMLNITVRN